MTPTPGLLLHRWEAEGGTPNMSCRDCKVCAYASDGAEVFRPFDEQECPIRLRGKLEDALRGQEVFGEWLAAYSALNEGYASVTHKFNQLCPRRPSLLRLVK